MAKNKKEDFGYIEEAVLDIEVEPAPEMEDYPKRAAARRKAREEQSKREGGEPRSTRDLDDQTNYMTGPSVGVLFRQARLKLKRDVSEVAQMLRIRKEYLQAIEDGRYSDLPGHTYAIGFVRAYASNLGLDPDEIVQKFKEETGGAEPQVELVMPQPVQESRTSGLGILVVLAILGAVLYGAWYFLAPGGDGDGGTAGTSAGEAGATEGATAGSGGDTGAGGAAGSSGAEGATGGTGEAGATDAGASGGTAAGAGGSTDGAAAGTTGEAGASAGTTGEQQAAVKPGVKLTASKGDAWIRITSPNGDIIVQTILRKGVSYEVPKEPEGLRLLVGNSGALEAFLGEESLGPIGPLGIVRRNIPLDPGKLEAALKAR